MRVVFLIEDSLPNGAVGPELTPTLWSLIEQGGWAPGGGTSVLASSTYPNHATFATGTDVQDHRIFTNRIHDGDRFVCSSTIGPVGETLFAAARAAGRTTSVVLGDNTMIGSMGAGEADVSWPPSNGPRDDVATDCLGYPANEVVIEQIDELEALSADLAIVHMNDPDSTLHLHGPDAAEAASRIRAVDDDLAAVVERIRPAWDDTVLFVVSDHEQEAIDPDLEPVRFADELATAGLPGAAHDEGMAGIVYGGPGADRLRSLSAISGALDLDVAEGISLVWSEPGRVFGGGHKTFRGQHGSPRTTTQVAAVAGGHPAVRAIARSLATRQPHASDWAPTMAALLGIPLPAATGTPLVAI
ncbi:MAG: alkaline phosphatase family protein [Acidimicrobiales bacterium]